MRNPLKSFCVLLMLLWTAAQAGETTLHLINTTQLQQFPGVQIYILDFWSDGVLDNYKYIGTESGYVNFYADSVPGEPLQVYEHPQHWVKESDLQIGDWWYGFWDDDSTHEEVLQDTTWYIGTTPFPAKEVEVTFLNPPLAIGSKWFSNGVGMMGSHFTENGYVDDQQILDYSVVGGSGNWPLAVGNWWRFQSTYTEFPFIAPTAYITLDGNMSDWSSLDPALMDPSGDDNSNFDGCDIKNLYIALNPSRTILYLMATFWDGSPSPFWGQVQNSAYHFSLRHVSPDSGAEIDVTYWANQQWQLSGWNVNVSNAFVAVGSVVEIGIPVNDLGNPQMIWDYSLEVTTGMQGTDWTTDRDIWLIDPPPPGVENPEEITLPHEIILLPNSPNPFNRETIIRYELPAAAQVRLEVFDLAGRLVETLINQRQFAGPHQASFSGKNLASGIYLCMLRAGSFQSVQKLVLLK